MSSGSIRLSRRLGWSRLGISGISQLISLEDQDKQQISFLVIRFTVKHSDWLVAPSSASSRLSIKFGMMMMMMNYPPVTAAS